MREIDAALKDLNEALAAIGGCGDGGCVIVKPKGMHTNGGCRCPANRLQMTRFAYAHNQFADAVRTASAAAQEPAAPRVRKLDWRELHMERSEADPSTEVVGFEARASSGSYYVIDIDDDVFDLTHDHTTVGIFYTEHEAKAAAQQDFARRIMSALTLPAEGCDSAAAAQSSSETNHGH